MECDGVAVSWDPGLEDRAEVMIDRSLPMFLVIMCWFCGS